MNELGARMTTGDTSHDNTSGMPSPDPSMSSSAHGSNRWKTVSVEERRAQLVAERETLAEFDGELRAFRSELERQRSELDQAARAHNIKRTELALQIDALSAGEEELAERERTHAEGQAKLADLTQSLASARAGTIAELETLEQERVRVEALRAELHQTEESLVEARELLDKER